MPGGSSGGNQHPGNDYFVQPTTGTIQRQSNPLAQIALEAAGFQGPMTWDQAQTVLVLGKRVSQQNGPATPTSTGGTISQTGGAVKSTAQAAANAVSNPLAGLASIGDFFARLTQASTWLRLGEGILGIILIAVGVARMTHAVPVATKIAKAIK